MRKYTSLGVTARDLCNTDKNVFDNTCFLDSHREGLPGFSTAAAGRVHFSGLEDGRSNTHANHFDGADSSHAGNSNWTESGYLYLQVAGCAARLLWATLIRSQLLFFPTQKEVEFIYCIDLSQSIINDEPAMFTHKSHSIEIIYKQKVHLLSANGAVVKSRWLSSLRTHQQMSLGQEVPVISPITRRHRSRSGVSHKRSSSFDSYMTLPYSDSEGNMSRKMKEAMGKRNFPEFETKLHKSSPNRVWSRQDSLVVDTEIPKKEERPPSPNTIEDRKMKRLSNRSPLRSSITKLFKFKAPPEPRNDDDSVNNFSTNSIITSTGSSNSVCSSESGSFSFLQPVTLSDQMRQKMSAVITERSSVWSDLPRLYRNLTLWDVNGKQIAISSALTEKFLGKVMIKRRPSRAIELSHPGTYMKDTIETKVRYLTETSLNLTQEQLSISIDALEAAAEKEASEEREKIRINQLRDLLVEMCLRMKDIDTAALLREGMVQNVPCKSDLSRELYIYFAQLIDANGVAKLDDMILMRLLRTLTQSIVAAPYLRLKSAFSAVQLPVKDVNGLWSIDVRFHEDRVTVTHSKRCTSSEANQFHFLWRMCLEVDRDIREVLSVDMNISQIEFDDNFGEREREKIRKIQEEKVFLKNDVKHTPGSSEALIHRRHSGVVALLDINLRHLRDSQMLRYTKEACRPGYVRDEFFRAERFHKH
ncbi:hypothetical protein PROFUN_11023 [Planoprotostelium fungivorum]|uniref:PH domain-containing protein n=1 Tax=Planoprotostelium fungivorum TaxID=1890364 RepID=A0A2P6NBU3_9EUKA|nr:hypothetical protein PROFUN_11023 [Planoprotostelium fungivorum]